MISENWLGSYIHLERVGDALDRIAGRLSRGGQFMRAVTEIEANYEALEIDFLAFSPTLLLFAPHGNIEVRTAQTNHSDSMKGVPADVSPPSALADLIALFREIDRDLIVQHNGRFVFPKAMLLHRWRSTIALNLCTRISVGGPLRSSFEFT